MEMKELFRLFAFFRECHKKVLLSPPSLLPPSLQPDIWHSFFALSNKQGLVQSLALITYDTQTTASSSVLLPENNCFILFHDKMLILSACLETKKQPGYSIRYAAVINIQAFDERRRRESRSLNLFYRSAFQHRISLKNLQFRYQSCCWVNYRHITTPHLLFSLFIPCLSLLQLS